MNQKQKEYAAERVKSIKRSKIEAAEKRHTVDGVTLSEKEKAGLIRAGKVKLVAQARIDNMYAPKLFQCFDFSKYEKDDAVNAAALDKEVDAIRKEAQRITDELMLGDAEAVLDAIRQFEAL